MKKIKLASLVLGISAASTLMVSCGSGDGSTASTATTNTVNTNITTSSNKALIPIGWEPYQNPLSGSSNSIVSIPIYQGSDYLNEPVITIYVNGNPIQVLVDTGATGLIVNQSAETNGNYGTDTGLPCNATYGDGTSYNGETYTATVCTGANNTGICTSMTYCSATQDTAFTSTDEIQGDFGLDCGLNQQAPGSICFPAAASYSTFSLSFINIPSLSYVMVSNFTPIGYITLGGTVPNGITMSYSQDPNAGLPDTKMYSPNNLSYSMIFDTGSNFDFFDDSILSQIPYWSSSSSSYIDSNNVLVSGLSISYSPTQSNWYSFITFDPDTVNSSFNLFANGVVYQSIFGLEDMGITSMYAHQWEWDINPQTDLVYQIKMY